MSNTEVTQRAAAIWARVSTHDQHAGNQLAELRAWAEQMDLEVVAEYVTEDSAWANGNGNGGKGAEFDAKRAELLQGVRQGRHPVVLLWAIDRISRRGTEDMTRTLRLLAEAGGDVRSLKDPWLHTSDPMARELLTGVFSTLAKYESQRRSDRITAGLRRRKAAGDPVGRQKGARDKKPRKRAGYTALHDERREQMQYVAANVTRLRAEHGWSRAELARRAGWAGPSPVSLIEAGRRHPGPRALGRLAAAFGVGEAELTQAQAR